MGTAIKYPVPNRVKPIFDIRIAQSDCTTSNFSTIYLCYSNNEINMTSEQSLAASSTSFSTVNISNSYEKSTEPEDLAVKMLTEKGKIYKTCSKWRPYIRTEA